MRKDVSGVGEGPSSKNPKNVKVQVQKLKKNEKRRFTRWRGPSSKNS